MDKTFFTTIEDRRKAFAERAGITVEDVRAELLLGSGRTYFLEQVIEAGDGWVHLDVRDMIGEQDLHSIVLPYYQITHLMFIKHKVRVPGFAR
jgi:hypothetical protein